LLHHYKDARVHCAVLKKRAGPGHTPHDARCSNWSARKAGCKQPTLQDPTVCFEFELHDPRFHSAGEPGVVLTSQAAQTE